MEECVMTSDTKQVAGDLLPGSHDFSLVLGGPLYQLLRRTHLAGDAMTLLYRRMMVITLVAWLPLLVLSLLQGQSLDAKAAVPFLRDIEVHVRFLLAMPLLIAAELGVHKRMMSVMQRFEERDLVPAAEAPKFSDAVASAIRLRNSVVAEVILLALVYVVGIHFIWRQYVAMGTATWYATPSDAGSKLSPAGFWYVYISLPFFQFLLIRWYFRLFIWARFLWRISRIKLNIVPTHPDRAGGLGFLAQTVHALTLLALAHGVLLSGQLANRIFFMGASLPQFKAEIVVVTVLMLILVLGPLMLFAPKLAHAKREGLAEYDMLAQRYVRDFDAKWLRGGAPADEPLVGSGDIQSLADLGNSLQVVRDMRIVPFWKEGIIEVAIVTLLPVAPLALTMMPLEELIKRLFGVLF
jgi:hypothetical protein